jgi:bifunctional DNA-binding transcriptional regulator/antitoxin component of YhaV-PrlF toxin-antitoxin module
MLAKLTSKNQITIPKRIIDQIPDARYFEVGLRDGVVVLKPLKTYSTSLEEIRAKVEKLDLDPECVREAVKWARSK